VDLQEFQLGVSGVPVARVEGPIETAVLHEIRLGVPVVPVVRVAFESARAAVKTSLEKASKLVMAAGKTFKCFLKMTQDPFFSDEANFRSISKETLNLMLVGFFKGCDNIDPAGEKWEGKISLASLHIFIWHLFSVLN